MVDNGNKEEDDELKILDRERMARAVEITTRIGASRWQLDFIMV
jgi:hypothetical protein